MSEAYMFPDVPPVFLELTNICNLKCPYCGNRNLKRPRGRISMGFVERMVEMCKAGGHELKWLHGAGEPLLHPGITDIVRFINRENGLDASFATNATLLTKEVFGELLDSGLRRLYISLDSIREDVYAKVRGADLSLVIDNLRNAIAMMPGDFSLEIALMDYEGQHIDDAYLKEFRRVFGPKENVRPNVINNVIQPASEVDMRANKYTLNHCIKPLQYFSVTFDGRVCLCCVDQDCQHELGDLNTQTIDEVWFASATQETLRRLVVGEEGCPEICLRACHMRPVPVQGRETEAPAAFEMRCEHARDFFTRINPQGLPHLDRVVGCMGGCAS